MKFGYFSFSKKAIVLLPPVALMLWHIFFMSTSSNFYNSRIDPEYPYLLNGLNCAIDEFHNIGHIDHPGTPFQLLTGLFIRILHLFLGSGDIVSDLVARPELYLTGCLFLLTLLAAGVSYWVSKKVYEATQNIKVAVLLGSSFLLYNVALNYSGRYLPDYLLIIIVLLMAVPIIQYLFVPTYSAKKFALFTGILAGIEIICKINFLPLVIVPFILVDKVRNKILFSVVFLLSAFLNFLPIIDKHTEVRKFLTGLLTHDGLYGSGNQQFLNLNTFLQNLPVFYQEHFWFLVVFTSVCIIIIVELVKKKQLFFQDRLNRFYLAFIIASLAGIVLVLKQYKGYYFAPLLALAIITYAIIWLSYCNASKYKKAINALFLIPVLVHISFLLHSQRNQMTTMRIETKVRQYVDETVKNSIKPENFKIIEPSWHFGLTVDCGLTYGLSYVASQNEFYNEYETKYANTLTWEGIDRPLYFLRMVPVFNNALFYSGKNIYLFDSPFNYNTSELKSFLEAESQHRKITYCFDTILYDNLSQVYLIEYRNLSTWNSINSIKCGFELCQNKIMLADDGLTQLKGENFTLVTTKKSIGSKAIKLSNYKDKSPGLPLGSYLKDDYLLVTLKMMGDLPQKYTEIITWNDTILLNSDLFLVDSVNSVINDNWHLIQMGFSFKNSKAGDNYLNIVNATNSTILIDDLKVEHFTMGKE